MNEMVERVAAAIDCPATASCTPGQRLHSEKCPKCLDMARNAIAAMREPTEAMVKAADGKGIDEDPTVYWTVMIDAALK